MLHLLLKSTTVLFHDALRLVKDREKPVELDITDDCGLSGNIDRYLPLTLRIEHNPANRVGLYRGVGLAAQDEVRLHLLNPSLELVRRDTCNLVMWSHNGKSCCNNFTI